jgi:hypothetical protein
MTLLIAVMILGQAAVAPNRPRPRVVGYEGERMGYRVAVTANLRQRRFEELEAQVQALRSGRDRFGSGLSKLSAFYQGLIPLGETAPASVADLFETALKEWQAQRPDSITPRAGLIHLEQQRAFTARGLEFAPKVTPEGWKGMEEHMKRAWQMVDTAEPIKEKDAEYFSLLIHLCQAGHCARGKAEGFLKAGLAIDPSYDGLYVSMADYLLPQWQGSVEDVTRFAARAADESRQYLGDIAYSRVATVALMTEGDALPQRYPGLSWQRIQKGLADLDERFPNSARTFHLSARFACAYHDPAVAQAAFTALGGPVWSRDAEAIWFRQERLQQCYEATKAH